MGTRKEDVRRELPQVAEGSREHAREGVIIPLASYIRRHRETADAFVLGKFTGHRITAIGECHENRGTSGGFEEGPAARTENICVRLFLRDIVLQLYRQRARTRLRFLVIESDEDEITREMGYHWQDRSLSDRSTYPAGTRNRSAYWHARSLERGRPRHQIPNLAFMEALLEISRSCDDSDFEVVGVDYFARRQELEGGQPAPEGESPEERMRRREEDMCRMESAHEEREQRITENLRRKVIARLGSEDRALMYYGMGHVEERDVEPAGTPRLVSAGSCLQRLAASGDLSPADVYTVATCYEGTAAPDYEMSAPGGGDDTVDSVLVRIYDLIRAEFEDCHSLGFDVDEAENDSIVFETGLHRSLGEAFDGYLFFRDLNSWNGTANLPEADRARRNARQPPLRVTQIIPDTAPAGNRVFVYGHVFTGGTRVRLGSHLLTPRIINENVCEISVPSGSSGAQVDVAVERLPTGSSAASGDLDRLLEDLATPPGTPLTYTLRRGFRYR